MTKNIRTDALNGIKWTTISSATTIVGQMIQVAILARLLSPEDFGIIGIASLCLTFISLFLDIGLTNLVIQKDNLSKEDTDSIFWFNIFSSLFFFLIIELATPFIAHFYGKPQLANVLQLLALSLLITPVEYIFHAFLRKHFLFNKIAVRNILSQVTGAIAGISSAVYGMGVYSLVVQHLTTSVVAAFCTIIAGKNLYQPTFNFRIRSIRAFLPFGFFVTADGILNFFNRNIDALLIGKLAGLPILGIYSNAKNIALKPYGVINPIITEVNFPLMARYSHDLSSLRNIYLKMTGYLSAINFPVYFFMAAFSEEVITVLLGEKWLSATPVLQLLSFAFMIRSVYNPMGSLFLALGKPKLSFLWNLLLFALVPVSILLSASFGIKWMAFSQFIIMLALFIPSWYLIRKQLGIGLIPYASWVIKSLTACLFAVLLPVCFKLFFTTGTAIGNLLVGALLFGPTYLYFAIRFQPQLRSIVVEHPVLSMLSKKLKRSNSFPT